MCVCASLWACSNKRIEENNQSKEQLGNTHHFVLLGPMVLLFLLVPPLGACFLLGLV